MDLIYSLLFCMNILDIKLYSHLQYYLLSMNLAKTILSLMFIIIVTICSFCSQPT